MPPSLQWRHNEHDGVSNHRRLECLLNRLFRRRSKKTSKLCVTGLCEGNPPVTGGFPSQRASYAEYGSIWWRHHDLKGTISTISGTYWLVEGEWRIYESINLPSLVQIMASRLVGTKPLSEPNAGILLIGPLGTNFSEILITIHTFAFKKMHLKMSSEKWRPFCLGLNTGFPWIVRSVITTHLIQMSQRVSKIIVSLTTVIWNQMLVVRPQTILSSVKNILWTQ